MSALNYASTSSSVVVEADITSIQYMMVLLESATGDRAHSMLIPRKRESGPQVLRRLVGLGGRG